MKDNNTIAENGPKIILKMCEIIKYIFLLIRLFLETYFFSFAFVKSIPVIYSRILIID